MSLLTASPPPRVQPYIEHRWTIAEFERMIKAGLLLEGDPEYLWDGKVVRPMGENESHITALDLLLEQLRARLALTDWWVRQDHPLRLREHLRVEWTWTSYRKPSWTKLLNRPRGSESCLDLNQASPQAL